MMVWALLFVGVRLYAKFHARRGLGMDDCKICFYPSLAKRLMLLVFCIIATILAISFTIVTFLCEWRYHNCSLAET